MPRNTLPPQAKRALDNACKKAGDHVRKVTPGRKNKAAVAKAFNQRLCKDVDQKLLKVIAQELAKPAKNTPPKLVKGVPKLVPPGRGVPSVTVPIPVEIPIDGIAGGPDTKGKFELKIWADPRELEKKDKGAMLYFSVEF